jgi:hypothetical protein
MRVHVLGLGPGIEKFTNPDEDLTIGVNDIHRLFKTDFVFCMDKINRFEPSRFDTILHCKPKKFFTIWPEWLKIRDGELVKINNQRPGTGGKVDTLGNWNKLPYHVDSTFTAACIAWHFIQAQAGFGSVILWGCHFYGHHQLGEMIQPIQRSYARLHLAMHNTMVTLYNTSPNGALCNILPFHYV